jgi:aerobic C4-dicarboxylate transport protein
MVDQTATAESTAQHRPFFKSLYFQVLTAIVVGVLLGHFYPEIGEQMKPLGDAFIKTIKRSSRQSSSVRSCPALPVCRI